MLDARTLLFSIAAGFAAMGAMGIFLSLLHRKEVAIRYWSAGCFTLAAANGLLTIRESVPGFVSVVIANGLAVSGVYLLHAGFAAFYRRPPLFGVGISISLGAMAMLAYWYYEVPDFHARVIVCTAALLPAFGMIAALLVRDSLGPYRPIRLGLAVLLMLLIVASLLRIVYTIIDPGPDDMTLFDYRGIETFWYIAVLTVMFISSLNFLLMPSQRAQMELSDLAAIDELTGLLNRRAFNARLRDRAASVGMSGGASLMLLDLDSFKSLNDEHGHAAGDAVLCKFSSTVADQLRRRDVFARYGGEEFAVLLPETDLAQASVVAERIRRAVETMRVQAGGRELVTTVSIGVTAVPERPDDYEAAIASADEALYRAKNLGRNRVCVLG